MSLARLTLTEFAPISSRHTKERAAGGSASADMAVPEGSTQEALENLRMEGYSEGFSAGVARTKEALAQEATALDAAVLSALEAVKTAPQKQLEDAVDRLRPAIMHLFEACIPGLLNTHFEESLIASLKTALPDLPPVTLRVHSTQSEHLKARIMASEATENITVESAPELAPGTAQILGRETTLMFDPGLALAQSREALDCLFQELAMPENTNFTENPEA